MKSDYAASSGDSVHFDALDLRSPTSYSQADNGFIWTVTDDPNPPTQRGQPNNKEFFQSGIMYYRSKLEIQQIEDGTSNTYLVGEKFLPSDAYDGELSPSDDGFEWGYNQSMYTGYDWDNQRVAWQPDADLDVDEGQPLQDRPWTSVGFDLEQPQPRFGSAHSGGFNMTFADGSVHFISYDIDPATHRWLANRLDGNVVPGDEY